MRSGFERGRDGDRRVQAKAGVQSKEGRSKSQSQKQLVSDEIRLGRIISELAF